MKGRNIYFTQKELKAIRSACSGYCDMMSEGEDTIEIIESEMECGLGSALYKLYKGAEGEELYKEYGKS